MQVVLDIENSKMESFRSIIDELPFVETVTEIEDAKVEQTYRLIQSLNEVKNFQDGIIELDDAWGFVNEL
jgi:protease II